MKSDTLDRDMLMSTLSASCLCGGLKHTPNGSLKQFEHGPD